MSMRNVLCKMDYYRSKSIMIMESSTSVNYSTCTPYLQFKFAERSDNRSGGKWDNDNAYWITGYAAIIDCATQMHELMTDKLEQGAEFKNPQKNKAIKIYKNVADNGSIWFVFHFFNGDNKVSVSLTDKEFSGLFKYISHLITNYPMVASTTLLRNELWWEFIGKRQADKTPNNGDGGYQNNKSSGGSYRSNKSSGGSYQNNKPSNSKPASSTSPPANVNSSVIEELENEFNSMSLGGDSGVNGDVPF